MRRNVLKRMLATTMVLSMVFSAGEVLSAKTATYEGKTVTYKYEMGTVPYGATNYLEVCTAKMSYPKSIKLKIKGTITGKKGSRTSTTTYTVEKKSTSCKNELAFEVPGYDITHFKGVYTIAGKKSYTIDKKIV